MEKREKNPKPTEFIKQNYKQYPLLTYNCWRKLEIELIIFLDYFEKFKC